MKTDVHGRGLEFSLQGQISGQGQAKVQSMLVSPYRPANQTRDSCRPKPCKNATEGIAKMPCKCETNAKYRSRSRSGQISHGIKNNTSIVWHMLYGSFGTKSSMVTHIFISDPRSGQPQVKKTLILKPIFLKIILFLSSFVSVFQKCHLIWCTTIINANK